MCNKSQVIYILFSFFSATFITTIACKHIEIKFVIALLFSQKKMYGYPILSELVMISQKKGKKKLVILKSKNNRL